MDYRNSGVDIEAGYKSVELMKKHVARTATAGAIDGIGGFGGLFLPDLKGMEEPVLVEMAHELTDLIRRSRTVDWDKKQSARAYMRTQVKHLLRKYKYPPEQAKGAIDTVIKQAELMSANMSV